MDLGDRIIRAFLVTGHLSTLACGTDLQVVSAISGRRFGLVTRLTPWERLRGIRHPPGIGDRHSRWWSAAREWTSTTRLAHV